jgi:hypothetical protein
VPDAVEHIRAVAATVQPLRPILVYLWQQDARATLERVVGERPQEWKDFVIDYFTQQGWGKAARASGFECVIAFYEHCAIRSDRMRIQDVLLLYDYNYWATKRILAASTNVSVQQFLAPTTHSYGSLRGTLVHTLDAEYGWRMVCQHNTLTPDMSEAEFPALDVLEQRWREEEMAMRDYLASLQDNHPATSISRCS